MYSPTYLTIVAGSLAALNKNGAIVRGFIERHLSGKHNQKTHARGGAAGTFAGGELASGQMVMDFTKPKKKGKSAVKATLDRVESDIRHKKIEEAIAVDNAGQVVFRKDGTHNEVKFTRQEADSFKGLVMTHNHPSDNSFSQEDVMFMTETGMTEIRAVGDKWRHSIKPPKEPAFTGESASAELFTAIVATENNVKQDFFAAINKGSMTIPEAEANHYHELWTRMSRRYGYKYKREAWDS